MKQSHTFMTCIYRHVAHTYTQTYTRTHDTRTHRRTHTSTSEPPPSSTRSTHSAPSPAPPQTPSEEILERPAPVPRRLIFPGLTPLLPARERGHQVPATPTRLSPFSRSAGQTPLSPLGLRVALPPPPPRPPPRPPPEEREAVLRMGKLLHRPPWRGRGRGEDSLSA